MRGEPGFMGIPGKVGLPGDPGFPGMKGKEGPKGEFRACAGLILSSRDGYRETFLQESLHTTPRKPGCLKQLDQAPLGKQFLHLEDTTASISSQD